MVRTASSNMASPARALVGAILACFLSAAPLVAAVNFAVIQELAAFASAAKISAKTRAAVLDGSAQLEEWTTIVGKSSSKQDAKTLAKISAKTLAKYEKLRDGRDGVGRTAGG